MKARGSPRAHRAATNTWSVAHDTQTRRVDSQSAPSRTPIDRSVRIGAITNRGGRGRAGANLDRRERVRPGRQVAGPETGDLARATRQQAELDHARQGDDAVGRPAVEFGLEGRAADPHRHRQDVAHRPPGGDRLVARAPGRDRRQEPARAAGHGVEREHASRGVHVQVVRGQEILAQQACDRPAADRIRDRPDHDGVVRRHRVPPQRKAAQRQRLRPPQPLPVAPARALDVGAHPLVARHTKLAGRRDAHDGTLRPRVQHEVGQHAVDEDGNEEQAARAGDRNTGAWLDPAGRHPGNRDEQGERQRGQAGHEGRHARTRPGHGVDGGDQTE